MARRVRCIGRNLVLFLALAAPGVASADILHLKPRGKVEGTIVDEDSRFYIVQLPDGGTTRVEKARVDHIEKGAVAPRPKTAESPSSTPATTPDAPSEPSQPDAAAPRSSAREGTNEDPLLVAPSARLGLLAKPEDIEAAPASFKKALDGLLASTPSSTDVANWVAKNAKSADERRYVLHRMETLADADPRAGLWTAWLSWSKPADTEGRVATLATSDLRYARFDALRALKPIATWPGSGRVVSTLLECPDDATQAAVVELVTALVERSLPDVATTTRFVERFRDAKDPLVRDGYGRVLALLARKRSGAAIIAIKATFASASGEAKARLLPMYVDALDESLAHDTLTDILGNTSSDRALLRIALALLPAHGGDVSDVPVCRPLIDLGNSEGRPSLLAEAAITCIAQLGQQPRFRDVESLDEWWLSLQPTLRKQADTIALIAGGGQGALQAIADLASVNARDVSAALRKAASSSNDAAVRKSAALTLINRRDHKAAAAIIEAFQRANTEDRGDIAKVLRRFLESDDVPNDPDALASWWRDHFPDDFPQ